MIKLYRGDCLDIMPTLPDASVHLHFTSPPYNCNKDYNSVCDNLPIDQYWKLIENYLQECYRTLTVGGRLALNIPWWIGKKPRQDYPFMLKTLALKSGFLFIDKIIWIKGNENNTHVSGGFGGGGSGWGTYMSPSGPAIRCSSEPILIFSKEQRGRKVLSGKGNGDCIKGDITKNEFMEFTKDTWFVMGGRSKQHPAIFPEEIAYRVIKLYTYNTDTVVDSFMGSGTTGKVSFDTGRNFIGIEQDTSFFNIAVKRITETGGRDIEVIE